MNQDDGLTPFDQLVMAAVAGTAALLFWNPVLR